MTNQKYLKLLRAMSSQQLALYYARLKKGYTDERIYKSSKSGRVAVVMSLHDKLLGSFRVVIYPDGSVEGGRLPQDISIRRDF